MSRSSFTAFLTSVLLSLSAASSASASADADSFKKYGPPSEARVEQATQAYGFYYARKALLEAAIQKFPQKAAALRHAEAVFAHSAYGQAIAPLARYVRAACGPQFFTRTIPKAQALLVPQIRQLTEEDADRLQRKFSEGPFCEAETLENCRTFLHFNDSLAQDPVRYFDLKLLTTLRTEGLPKAQGLVMTLDVPENWSVTDGKRPHILWRISGEEQVGFTPELTVHINRFKGKAARELRDAVDLFSLPGAAKEYLSGIGADIENYKITRANGHSALLYTMPVQRENLGREIYSETLGLTVHYEDMLITVSASLLSLEDHPKALKEAFARYKPLFLRIMDSITIYNPYR